MGEMSIFGKVKCFIGSMSWKLFLWSISMSDHEYWRTIYEQEAAQVANEAGGTDNQQRKGEIGCNLKCLSDHCTLKQGYCHNLKVVATSPVA